MLRKTRGPTRDELGAIPARYAMELKAVEGIYRDTGLEARAICDSEIGPEFEPGQTDAIQLAGALELSALDLPMPARPQETEISKLLVRMVRFPLEMRREIAEPRQPYKDFVSEAQRLRDEVLGPTRHIARALARMPGFNQENRLPNATVDGVAEGSGKP